MVAVLAVRLLSKLLFLVFMILAFTNNRLPTWSLDLS